jgi:NADPH-dependent curcumin reductase CurA
VTTALTYVLARRPRGQVREDDFRLTESRLRDLATGDIELETLLISLDPAIRGWLDDRPSYLPPVQLGGPVRALGIGRVTQSRNDAFRTGDILRGFTGWQQRQVLSSPSSGWDRINPRPRVPLESYLGVLGMTGLTAWAGVRDILRPEPSHTVLVSAASGAVGTIAVQLAKSTGARVVGIAGGAQKCRMLTGDLGADTAVNRRAPDWREQLTAAVPDGIDRLFENAGGPLFEASISLLNNHARIALCGLIDGYNLPERPAGPANFGLLLTKRVLTQGFIVLDYMDRSADVEAELAAMLDRGDLREVQTVVGGFRSLPHAFVQSFTDGPPGKLVVDVAVDRF